MPGASRLAAPCEAALLRPVPRRVRASRALRRMRWAAGNVAGLLVAAIALVSSGRALYLKDYVGFSWFAVLIIGVWAWREIASRRERRLLRSGIPVRASLLSITPAPSARVNERRFRVVFVFATNAGEALTRTVTVDEERADKLRAGNGTATLLYNPADPKRAEPYFALEDAEIE